VVAEVRLNGLLEDRALLDRVTRALCLACDCDSVESFERLDEWADLAAGRIPKGEVTVFELLGDAGPANFNVIANDVLLMEREDAAAKADQGPDVITLDSTDPKIGQLEVAPDEVDAAGKVPLPEDSDRAHLLTDAYSSERAWLRAKELSSAYNDEGGREAFERDYRQHIEAGADFLACLEWANGPARAQQAIDQTRQLNCQRAQEAAERERRA
jgi:hypothetical protein